MRRQTRSTPEKTAEAVEQHGTQIKGKKKGRKNTSKKSKPAATGVHVEETPKQMDVQKKLVQKKYPGPSGTTDDDTPIKVFKRFNYLPMASPGANVSQQEL